MSKIGKKPVNLPEGVTAEIKDDQIEIKGKNGSLTVVLAKSIEVQLKDKEIIFKPLDSTKQTESNWGTMRALVQNAVEGVANNFRKELIIEGVGYRANLEGEELVLQLGFSRPVRFATPKGIKIAVEKNTIKIEGFDKALVGETAARIRNLKKPEPYKGKGIRYSDEVIRRKAGKKAVGAGGK
ncbi:MAG: 50S ribosomal protein L6 [Candidatus Colwellbacteria bacterium]|nr:50S ribosomal protein L6 [Candidatus Colwellbacteria bacterium]